jgi:hypothetical protein
MTWRNLDCGRALLIAVFASTISAHAQEEQASRWKVQLVGGPQIMWLNDPLGVANGAMTGRRVQGLGYFLGTEVDHQFHARVGLRCAVHWSDRGSTMTVDDLQQPRDPTEQDGVLEVGTRSFRLRSIVVPLLLTWEPWPGFRFLGGPSASRLLEARETFTGQRFTPAERLMEGTETIDRTAWFEPLEWSMVLGFEVRGPRGFGLGVRHGSGFTHLERVEGASPSRSISWQLAATIPLWRHPSRHQPTVVPAGGG